MTIDLQQFYCININNQIYGSNQIIPNFNLELEVLFLEDIWRYSRKVHNFIEKFFKYLLSVSQNQNYELEFKCFNCFSEKVNQFSNQMPSSVNRNPGSVKLKLTDNFISLWDKLFNFLPQFKFGFCDLYGDFQDGIVQICSYDSLNEIEKKLKNFKEEFSDDFHVIIDGNEHLYLFNPQLYRQKHEELRNIISTLNIKYNDLYAIEKSEKSYSRKLYSKEFKRLVYIFPHGIKLLAKNGEIWRLDSYFGFSRATIELYILYNPCNDCPKNVFKKL